MGKSLKNPSFTRADLITGFKLTGLAMTQVGEAAAMAVGVTAAVIGSVYGVGELANTFAYPFLTQYLGEPSGSAACFATFGVSAGGAVTAIGAGILKISKESDRFQEWCINTRRKVRQSAACSL